MMQNGEKRLKKVDGDRNNSIVRESRWMSLSITSGRRGGNGLGTLRDSKLLLFFSNQAAYSRDSIGSTS